ncbi:MAG: PAS domain-containing protein [Alphaproteobacteria bacterium]
MQNILERIVSAQNRKGLEYWMSKRGARRMPSRSDIDPAEIVGLLANVILIDVEHDPLDFRYRLIGTLIDAHMKEPMTGRWMSSIPHQRAPSRIWSACKRVVEEREPHSSDIPYVGPMKDFVVCEDILMPLSEDGESVDVIFVVIDYLREADLPAKPAGDMR